MWAKLKASCMHSATVAWSYVLLAWSAALENIDSIADAIGDPNLDQQVKGFLGDAKLIARYTAIVAVITLAARLRSKVKAKKG